MLKTIYDRSKRAFVVCTGSSALSLQSTGDLARRVVFEKLYPMNFTEYMLLKTKYESIKDKNVTIKFSVKGLKEAIKNTLFYSSDADECFSRLADLKAQVNKYWFGVDTATLAAIKNILLLVAGSGEVSVTKLAQILKGISIVYDTSRQAYSFDWAREEGNRSSRSDPRKNTGQLRVGYM